MRQQSSYPFSEDPAAAADSVLDASRLVPTLTVSSRGAVLRANPAFKQLLGLRGEGDLVGRRLVDVSADKETSVHWKAALQEGARRGVDVRFRDDKGRSVALRGDIVRVSGPAGETWLRGVFVDTGGERQARQALQRSARLEALASLTSGVAHDFNNLLTVLVGNLSLVAEELRGKPDIFAKLKASRDAAKRGSDLIRQLLGFARNEAVETGVIDPAKIIDNLLPLLRRALGSRVQLGTEFAAGACTVRANVAQLESVIVNLAVNAKDAIDAAGKVTIAAASVDLSSEQAAARGLSPGRYVRIAVCDDGKGIPAEARERVFEPFFTTKGDRGGTGLGLSMVRAFASQSGGAAYVESEVGEGTSVVLLLPHCAEHVDETSAKTMPLSVLPTGTEQVVLLSGDEGLRSTVRQILEALGYTVKLCSAVDELLMAVQGGGSKLLISDGPFADACGSGEQADAVVARCRNLPRIVLTSGDYRPPPGVAESVLAKPFSLADLAEIVRKALDGSD